MAVCVIDYIENNYESLFWYAMKRSKWDRRLSEDSISYAFTKANDPDKICKIDNPWWVFNSIKEYIKNYWKKRRKERETFILIDWIDEKGEISTSEEDFITKEYLNFILGEIISFIRKRYPLAQAKYTHYFEICCYQKLTDDPWDNVQKNFPLVNVKEVQSRCAEILKEFKKYYSKKKEKWN